MPFFKLAIWQASAKLLEELLTGVSLAKIKAEITRQITKNITFFMIVDFKDNLKILTVG